MNTHYGTGELRIYRFDLPLKSPLVIGSGKEIYIIPYYFTRIGRGESWTVSSPLWGGYGNLEEGIVIVENLIKDASAYVWDLVKGTQKGRINLREFQALIRGINTSDWTDYGDVPGLIKSMAFAPSLSALVDSEARHHDATTDEYLRAQFGQELSFNELRRPRRISVALTVSGEDTIEDVVFNIFRYGRRSVLKLKIGTRGIEQDSEFVAHAVDGIKDYKPFYILDNNQAYTVAECMQLLDHLQRSSSLDRLLFIEQPCRIGEESQAISALEEKISQGLRIAMDESVASSDDAKKIGQLAQSLPEQYRGNVLVIPKIEKMGLIEFMEIMAAAEKYGMSFSPATLTGPPNQFALFLELAASLQCFSMTNGVVPVEANGYELLEWDEIARKLSMYPENAVFSTTATEFSLSRRELAGLQLASRTANFEGSPWLKGEVLSL